MTCLHDSFLLHFVKLLLILRYRKIYFPLNFILKNLLPVKIIRALSRLPGICELILPTVLRMNFLMCLGFAKPFHILECILNASMLSNFVIFIFFVESYELCLKLVFCICPAPWRVAPFYYTGLLEQEVSCRGRLFPGSLHTRS